MAKFYLPIRLRTIRLDYIQRYSNKIIIVCKSFIQRFCNKIIVYRQTWLLLDVIHCIILLLQNVIVLCWYVRFLWQIDVLDIIVVVGYDECMCGLVSKLYSTMVNRMQCVWEPPSCYRYETGNVQPLAFDSHFEDNIIRTHT